MQSGKNNSHRHVVETAEIGDVVSQFITQAAKESIAARGIFTLGVSGGSIINILGDTLTKKFEIEWEKWRVFFCDERHVPFSNPESTYSQYKKNVIDPSGSGTSWFAINPDLNVEDCAKDYQTKINQVFNTDGIPSFDMLLLGMGPDGHTCSLFPAHKLLQEKQLIIAPIDDSPKPPPCRVTMTLPVLNNARNVMFISAGASKAETIKKVFSSDSNLPASLVKPENGVLRWVMDKAAASLL